MKKAIIVAVLALTVLTGCGAAQLPELDQSKISEVFLFESNTELEPVYIELEAVQQQIISWYHEAKNAKAVAENLPGDYFHDVRALNILVMKMEADERFVFYAFYPREQVGRVYFEHFVGEGNLAKRKAYTIDSQRLYNFIVRTKELSAVEIVTEAKLIEVANDVEAEYKN